VLSETEVESRLKLRVNRSKSAVAPATRRPFLGFDRFTVGWTAYFAYADTPRPFAGLGEWLRRRLRAGALEGVEALPDSVAQPASARHPRAGGP
jgi:hypothetical protein